MGDWKLIERYEDGRVHLFNLRDDVGEQNDLALKHAGRVAENAIQAARPGISKLTPNFCVPRKMEPIPGPLIQSSPAGMACRFRSTFLAPWSQK